MPLHSDRTPQNALEAAWCANIDRRYCEGLEFSHEEWTGPIRGPLLSCMNLMHEALFESLEEGTKPVHCPLLAAQLAQHVCAGSVAPFVAWRDAAIDRLNLFYRAPDPFLDLYGESVSRLVIPPQAFDPDIEFDIEQASRLADDFLRSVDYRNNPLLVAPEQLKRDGFEGEPYRYNKAHSA
jgi:hypothetical protein